MINKTQIMKGILEGCVLAVLSREMLYSQEIPKKLLEYKMSDVSISIKKRDVEAIDFFLSA